jgi:hypothetical protein
VRGHQEPALGAARGLGDVFVARESKHRIGAQAAAEERDENWTGYWTDHPADS